MDTFIIVLIVIAAIATATVLVRGVLTMARGKDITGEQSNKLMSYRVAFQLLTILLVGGAILGWVVGRLGAWTVARGALPTSGLYPLVVMTVAVLAYAAAASAHASGFAAVYIAALVLGNSNLPHRAATRSFVEGLAWVAQIGLFVMLGLLASPSHMPGAIIPALVAGVGLTLVARPISVWLSTAPFSVPRAEKIFLSWAGLRGAIPVVLATVPLAEGVSGADWLFAVVFIVAVVFTVIQAPPLPRLAAVLGVGSDIDARDVEVESAPLERLNADLLQVRVPEGSRIHGVEVAELRLPPGVSVALIVRGNETSVPGPNGVLPGFTTPGVSISHDHSRPVIVSAT